MLLPNYIRKDYTIHLLLFVCVFDKYLIFLHEDERESNIMRGGNRLKEIPYSASVRKVYIDIHIVSRILFYARIQN